MEGTLCVTYMDQEEGQSTRSQGETNQWGSLRGNRGRRLKSREGSPKRQNLQQRTGKPEFSFLAPIYSPRVCWLLWGSVSPSANRPSSLLSYPKDYYETPIISESAWQTGKRGREKQKTTFNKPENAFSSFLHIFTYKKPKLESINRPLKKNQHM